MSNSIKIKFNLTPQEPLTVFVLVVGGFFPPFAYSGLLLLDRNIISNAEGIANQKNHNDSKANSWWFDFINSPHYILNPVIAASECVKSKPTYNQFVMEFERCQSVLHKAFPVAQVINFNKVAFKGAYELMLEITQYYVQEINFLKQIIPLILAPKKFNELETIEKQIFSYYQSNGLKNSWLLVLACLYCLYECPKHKNKSPGRAVLKPKQHYSCEMAHNALWDIYSLQLIVQSKSQLNTNTGFCTCDKGLVKFWLALKINNATSETNKTTFNFELSTDLFQRLNNEEVVLLKERFYECTNLNQNNHDVDS